MVREINLEFNELYEPVFTTKARYIDIWGGRARGGSHFATDYFLFLITHPAYFRGCFLRAVFGDVRGSLWQDFKDRVTAAERTGSLNSNDFDFNESRMSVVYRPTGNSIISKGFKKSTGNQSAKLKSIAGITHVVIEECEEVDESDFNKLDDSLRTNMVDNIQVMRLFNPPSKNHWLMRRFYNLVPSGVKGWYKAIPKRIANFLSIHSTYKDNLSNLNDSTVKKYEDYGNKNSPNYNEDFYYRDVCGYVSEGKKGRIITRAWPITYRQFQALAFHSFYGLDFGYSVDPVALLELKYHNGKGYIHRRIYTPGLTDDDLADEMTRQRIPRSGRVHADSAEPKSIATLCRKGFNVQGAQKGADSVKNGIKFLQSMDLFVTEESKEVWREIEEYSWALDAEKEPTDTPVDAWNHAIDAARYGFTSEIQKGEANQYHVAAGGGIDNDPLDWEDEEEDEDLFQP